MLATCQWTGNSNLLLNPLFLMPIKSMQPCVVTTLYGHNKPANMNILQQYAAGGYEFKLLVVTVLTRCSKLTPPFLLLLHVLFSRKNLSCCMYFHFIQTHISVSVIYRTLFLVFSEQISCSLIVTISLFASLMTFGAQRRSFCELPRMLTFLVTSC